MPAADYTPYYQPQTSTSDGTKFDNLIAAIQATVNGLDDANWTGTGSNGLALSKLKSYPSDGTKFACGDGTWKVPSAAAGVGTELDYVQITSDVSITHTSEGTADTVITGTSIAYDATKKNIEVFIPQFASLNDIMALVILRGATVLGQIKIGVGTVTGVHSGGTWVVQDTPSAATFSYVVKAFMNSSTGTIKAGGGGSGVLLPAHLRVTKA